MTIFKNDESVMIPVRVQNCWRMYIDFKNLNATTKKDPFPISFIDQVLERLLKKSFFFY